MVANEAVVAHPSAGHVQIRVLRPRRSPSTIVICAVALVITTGATAEVMTSLIGAPLPLLQPEGEPASEVGACWTDPRTVLAALVVSTVGLFLLLTGFLPSEDAPMESGRDDRDQAAEPSFADSATT